MTSTPCGSWSPSCFTYNSLAIFNSILLYIQLTSNFLAVALCDSNLFHRTEYLQLWIYWLGRSARSSRALLLTLAERLICKICISFPAKHRKKAGSLKNCNPPNGYTQARAWSEHFVIFTQGQKLPHKAVPSDLLCRHWFVKLCGLVWNDTAGPVDQDCPWSRFAIKWRCWTKWLIKSKLWTNEFMHSSTHLNCRAKPNVSKCFPSGHEILNCP